MKRKFFSLMVAACAALVSFTSLTGCSGGIDKEERERTAGYMTYDDWKSGSKMFKFETALAFNIIPQPNSSSVSSNGISSECYFKLGNVMEMLDCRYRIDFFQAGQDADSTKSLPLSAVMNITFTDSSQLSERDFLAAFGHGTTTEGTSSFVRAIKVTLTYNTGGTGGGSATFEYSVSDDGVVTDGVNPNCNFEVKTADY